jgi:hypothetical protein
MVTTLKNLARDKRIKLEGKENAVRAFKKADLTGGSYDTSKLEFLLDYLVDQWIGKISSQ